MACRQGRFIYPENVGWVSHQRAKYGRRGLYGRSGRTNSQNDSLPMSTVSTTSTLSTTRVEAPGPQPPLPSLFPSPPRRRGARLSRVPKSLGSLDSRLRGNDECRLRGNDSKCGFLFTLQPCVNSESGGGVSLQGGRCLQPRTVFIVKCFFRVLPCIPWFMSFEID